MSAHFPDAASLRAGLMLALRAPSVHNSQPWRWRVGRESVHLYANPDLQLPHTDPDGRDLMLSCGAALNHFVVAMAALGWHSTIHRFPNEADANHLASMELGRRVAAEMDIALAAAIPRRRTDRRFYSAWPVPGGDIALMGARAARAGVTLRRIDDVANLAAVVTQAARRHATDDEYLRELAAWTGRYGATAGVPARNTPQPDPGSPVPGRIFAGAVLAQTPNSTPDVENAVVLALGTADDDAMARLRAGEATSLILLTATALGLASCPITEPLEVADTRAAVQTEVFGGGLYPQMLLRVGWAPVNADPLPATPCREFAEIVEYLDGSSFR